LLRRCGRDEGTALKGQLQEARWLIKALENRGETLQRVAEAIVRTQSAFLDHGLEAMRPLTLRDVAEQLDLHESTISRVTTGKYMHTPRGVYELKYFFNSPINTGDGDTIASKAVKDEIKRIVSAENAKKPLSDASIVKMLQDKNIDIARRTVAKYREELGILPSSRRKQVFEPRR
jgi:RNA polymerase sigma-54 factor